MGKDKLLVIIVTYNAMHWAERCFSCILNSIIKPDVLVVDNGSTDGTQAYIKDLLPESVLIQSDINLGFGKANNIGLQFALDNNYDYVYLLNQDAWFFPDTIGKLISISKKYPEYGILSPFQMNSDMMHIDRNFVANVLKWESNPDICSDMYNQVYEDVYPVSEVMAAHWFMTINCIRKVGGFSPTFTHYAEDGNYIDRVHYWGFKVGVVPSLKVVHDRGGRNDSVEKVLYLTFANTKKGLSAPNNNTFRLYIISIFDSFLHMIRYKSISPINYQLKITSSMGAIISNKKISMNSNCAFLRIVDK